MFNILQHAPGVSEKGVQHTHSALEKPEITSLMASMQLLLVWTLIIASSTYTVHPIYYTISLYIVNGSLILITYIHLLLTNSLLT